MSSVKSEKEKKKARVIRIWAVLFWLVLWEAAGLALGKKLLLPSPAAVFLRLGTLLWERTFWGSLGFSLLRIIGGFLTALAAGVLCACLGYRCRPVRELFAPAMAAVKAVPVASFVILILLWVPSRNLSAVIAFLMVLPVIYTNLLDGLMNMDPELLEMAAVFRMSSFRKARYLYLPQVFPFLRAACGLSLGLCWKAGIAAEVIGLPDGSIGEKLYQAKIYLETPDLFAWTIVIVLLSYSFEKLFLTLLSRTARRFTEA